MFNAGGWDTACDRTVSSFGFGFSIGQRRNVAEFTDESVDVACKQLGCAEGSKTQLSVRALVASHQHIFTTEYLFDMLPPLSFSSHSCSNAECSVYTCTQGSPLQVSHGRWAPAGLLPSA